ncbi:MAG: alpha/beta fold hydrolase, partial [Chthoniobacterales bacterium]|nr:alpha/beta fold hydrolase [Chthoniobacterales bacterium]
MPVIASSFRPPWYLSNCHVQTILPALTRVRPAFDFRRERMEMPDGDFLDLDWLESGRERLVILCAGLEGNSRDPGILRLAASFRSHGWDVLSWNYRGCSGELNRLRRSYHSGASDDLAAVVARAGRRPIALVGLSIGGNLVLKYLGEAPPPGTILAAATVSAPLDLKATVQALDKKPGNRIYLRRLITSLTKKIREKSAVMPVSYTHL